MIVIQENIELAKLTTFKIGGKARYFVEVANQGELQESIKEAAKLGVDFFVLGGGSNLLVSDWGFSGLVIKMKMNQINISEEILAAEAGVPLAKVVNFSVENGLAGMEWAAGIPGTVGGAVRGNAGAFGKSMQDVIMKVLAFDAKNKKVVEYTREGAAFGYRDSLFKQESGLVVLSATFSLKKGDKNKSSQLVKDTILKRVAGQPKGLGSAGSFFKNPIVTDEKLRKEFELDKGITCKDEKLPAGWLVEQVSLVGKKIGGAMISDVHSNYIVNVGGATAEDVVMLASLVKQQVRDKLGVQLQEEVQYLGF